MDAGQNKGEGKSKNVKAKQRSSHLRLALTFYFLLFAWVFAAGCATVRPQVDRALLADKGMASRGENVAESYAVYCPDVLDVTIDDRPEMTGQREIGPDGRIDLGNAERLRVEGRTVAEVAARIAKAADVPPARVHVRVAEYNSQQIYLIGQVVGLQRAVAYQGSESVLDLLHRVGGITPGAAPDNVYVVRSHVADGRQPEVFRVNLRAILLKQDQRSNIHLQPLDQVFVGETRQFGFEKCVPPWLRPAYEAVCGMRRPVLSSDRIASGQNGEPQSRKVRAKGDDGQ